jgi:glutamyl-tRNA synthetase
VSTVGTGGRAVRTRIAPSPTGYLHLGTARTALYSWAYARHHGGTFVLRIEDTDVARSTEASTEQILDALDWLGLDADEGPFFQMQRLDRYRAVAERLIAEGTAYRCWATPAELEAMREAQRGRGEKTHYDRRWRPGPGKALPPPPAGIEPVIRFANPEDGVVVWEDLVKGEIAISNREIDDLVIVRADGVPTYNFAVVVDDADMAISHVFRGDEHVNNTPWQLNLFAALGLEPPLYGHLPIILGDDGQKLSKRRGAVSVTAYRDAGYLPEGMLNYLARLGWSHGDEEVFDRRQFVAWFDGTHLSKSPAQWDAQKLAWVNAQHLKSLAPDALGALVREVLARDGVDPADPRLARFDAAVALFRERASTTVELASWVRLLVERPEPSAEDTAATPLPPLRPALVALADTLAAAEPWSKEAIAAAVKSVLGAHGLKMPAFAPAVRMAVCGRRETPSIDAVLALLDRGVVVERLRAA